MLLLTPCGQLDVVGEPADGSARHGGQQRAGQHGAGHLRHHLLLLASGAGGHHEGAGGVCCFQHSVVVV